MIYTISDYLNNRVGFIDFFTDCYVVRRGHQWANAVILCVVAFMVGLLIGSEGK